MDRRVRPLDRARIEMGPRGATPPGILDFSIIQNVRQTLREKNIAIHIARKL